MSCILYMLLEKRIHLSIKGFKLSSDLLKNCCQSDQMVQNVLCCCKRCSPSQPHPPFKFYCKFGRFKNNSFSEMTCRPGSTGPKSATPVLSDINKTTYIAYKVVCVVLWSKVNFLFKTVGRVGCHTGRVTFSSHPSCRTSILSTNFPALLLSTFIQSIKRKSCFKNGR